MAIGYRELAGGLRREIVDGTYPPDSTLPKQSELAERYGVNIKTVRQAIRVLEAEGLVTPVRRRGTVVRSRPPMLRLGIDRYAKRKWREGLVAFAADREASGRAWKPSDQAVTVNRSSADDEIAEALGIPEGSPVIERGRLVSEATTPTHMLTSYYRPADVEGTPLVDASPGPAGRGGGFAVLTAQGLEPQRMTETIHARMPTPDETDQLQLPAGEPVMVLRRTTFAAGDRPIEFARGVHAATRFVWSYSFDLPD